LAEQKKIPRRLETQILQALAGQREISVWKLISLQDWSLPEFYSALIELERNGLISTRGGVVGLTELGKEVVKRRGLEHVDVKCASCDGSGYVEYPVGDLFREIARERPLPVKEYDQGYINPGDVLKRVSFIYERGDLSGTKIFVVGDDDLLSVAMALTGMPERVVAVDIDRRVVDFINRVADRHGLSLEAEVYDVQQPPRFRKEFDVFVTDPVETLPGITLFLSRGVATLKGRGSVGYFGLTTLEASKKKWFEIEKRIHDMNFVITDIRRDFSWYGGEDNFLRYQADLPIVKKIGTPARVDWFRSSFFRIEAIDAPHPLVSGELVLGKDVYVDDESWATAISDEDTRDPGSE